MPYLFLILLIFCSCHRNREPLQPQMNFVVHDRYLQQLPAPFAPLPDEEKREDWGKEYLIGMVFAHQLDFYRAITAFRRAEILIPERLDKRKLEVQYEILLCYYYGKHFEEMIDAFDHSKLSTVTSDFPAFHDLLLILYDAYTQLGMEEKVERIRQILLNYYPETEENLTLSEALLNADFPTLKSIACKKEDSHYLHPFLSSYEAEKKSVQKAQMFNTFLPGSGYLYIGQKQTALTAFLVNGLFIAASVHFFQKGEIAAGIITASFEAGWYFGGIYGVGQEAKLYNERLFERNATPIMNQCRLYPALMLNYGF